MPVLTQDAMLPPPRPSAVTKLSHSLRLSSPNGGLFSSPDSIYVHLGVEPHQQKGHFIIMHYFVIYVG